MIVADFDKKMDTTYCIDLDTRDRQVLESCQRVKNRLMAQADHDGHIAVVCYGPSLQDTWEQLRGFDKIITCSGAHKFLIDRGIIPTWHCEVDPRQHKADLIGTPHKDVEYLIASVCNRKVFDLLDGFNAKLWHVFSHEAERDGIAQAFPRGDWLITGGSNIGLRAMVLARFLGFKKMTVFGMDFSFKETGEQHAGWHPKELGNIHAVEVEGKRYLTNPPMHQYAQEFFKEVTKIGAIEVDFVGDGLLQAKVRERLKTKPLIPIQEKRALIAAILPNVISAEYLEQNRMLHQTNPAYGVGGSRRADIVRQLIEKTKPSSVLDYGCGKGTLGASLAIPIWEYDPAIPGKDQTPRPADLVICTDVLEHIEPDYLDHVLLDISRCTMKMCYAVIHTGPAKKTLPDGRNTHLIQKPLEWWKEQFAKYFTIHLMGEVGKEISVLLAPKRKLLKAAA